MLLLISIITACMVNKFDNEFLQTRVKAKITDILEIFQAHIVALIYKIYLKVYHNLEPTTSNIFCTNIFPGGECITMPLFIAFDLGLLTLNLNSLPLRARANSHSNGTA